MLSWWKQLHPGIKILLGACLVYGLGKGALEAFLPYHDDPEMVRHAANRAGFMRCFEKQAHANPSQDMDQVRARCTCAGDHFASSLTDAQIKPLQTHKEQSAPAFQITSALQPQLDAAISACGT